MINMKPMANILDIFCILALVNSSEFAFDLMSGIVRIQITLYHQFFYHKNVLLLQKSHWHYASLTKTIPA